MITNPPPTSSATFSNKKTKNLHFLCPGATHITFFTRIPPRPPMHILHKTFPGTFDKTSHCAKFHSSGCLISCLPKTDLCETTECSPPLGGLSRAGGLATALSSNGLQRGFTEGGAMWGAVPGVVPDVVPGDVPGGASKEVPGLVSVLVSEAIVVSKFCISLSYLSII